MGIIKAAKGAAKVAKVANDVRKGDTGSTQDMAHEALSGAADMITGMIPGGKMARRLVGRHIDAGIDAGAGAIARGISQGMEAGMPAIAEGFRSRAFREGHGGPAPVRPGGYPDPFGDPFGGSPSPAPRQSGSRNSDPYGGVPGTNSPVPAPRSSGNWDPFDSSVQAPVAAEPEKKKMFGRRNKQQSSGGSGLPMSTPDDPFGDRSW